MINKKKFLSNITIKTLLIALIFTIVSTIIIGGGLLIGEQSIQIKPATLIESFKDCDKLKGTEKKDCYFNLARKNRDEGFCEKISAIEFRSMCYTDLAILKNDPELCGKATASLASSCREYFTKDEKLTIIYPNKDTMWEAGKTYQIRWTPANPELRVSVKLIDNSNESPDLARIAETRPFDTGSYFFFVPKNLKTNNKYHISITRHTDSVPIYIAPTLDGAESKEFTIISDESGETIELMNKMSDWLTYRNEEFGFELRYPKNWVHSKPKKYEVFGLTEEHIIRKIIEIIFVTDGEYKAISDEFNADNYALTAEEMNFFIVVEDNSLKLSIKDWLAKNDLKIGTEKTNDQEIKIAGNFCLDRIYEKNKRKVYIAKDNKIIVLGMFFSSGKFETFNQMLSTFKFIEKSTVTYPTKNTAWETGNTYQVRWQPNNSNDKIGIKLYKVPAVSLSLKWESSYPIPNTGDYSFTVPEWLETGKYQFFIEGEQSNEFSIVSK